jgi:hypothetical protein
MVLWNARKKTSGGGCITITGSTQKRIITRNTERNKANDHRRIRNLLLRIPVLFGTDDLRCFGLLPTGNKEDCRD